MDEKIIKFNVIRQLELLHPEWNLLRKKEKRKLAHHILMEEIRKFRSNPRRVLAAHELTGTYDIPLGLMDLRQMESYVKQERRTLFGISSKRSRTYIQDEELRAIDELLEDGILNDLLIPDGYTPTKREIFPYQLFRAELLKSLKYPELSYRKYCEEILCNLEQKTARAFVRLPLNRRQKISHSQLSQFRSGLAYAQMLNVLIYIIYILVEHRKLDPEILIAGVDSSELPSRCSSMPLARAKFGKHQVRIYSDYHADCGVRRSKRDKSKFFVGYRIHSLVALNPDGGQPYPLLSLVVPANHHDNLVLPQILHLASAMGLELKWITADEAYADAQQNEALNREMDVTIVTPPGSRVKSPLFTEPDGSRVYMDDGCDIPMRYLGRTEQGHEYRCGAEPEQCGRWLICEKCRELPFDAGYFGQLPFHVKGMEKLLGIRKNMERSYNLLKHREGLEPLRVCSQHGAMAAVTFAHAASLLLEVVGTRKSKKSKVEKQQEIDFG